ncbi:MAG: UDP-N-acetylmuramoyl-L-alanine--D-glutamate ligase [Myxococcota bacterium]
MSAAPWRRALVVGMGKSGRSVVRLLDALGVAVVAYDRSPPADLPAGVTSYSGETIPPEAYAGIDLMVLSPGVPPGPARALAAQHAPEAAIHGELGLALALIHSGVRDEWSPLPTVLITGTNGKSTVTAMLGAILEADGRRPFIGGNLGTPLCDVLTDALPAGGTWPGALVVECSSYQLETLPSVPTRVAMVLNVTPDHLDRYTSMAHYAETKGRIFAGLGESDLALLLADDDWTARLRPRHARVRLIGDAAGPHVEGEGEGTRLHVADGESMPRAAVRLPGRHNAVNAVFAVCAARHLGVSLASCEAALQAFQGLPHRMVHVRDLDGVAYYNDSKATNVASALASLGGLDRRFVLIAGGKAKGDDLAPLSRLVAARAVGLVTIGEAGPTFAALGRGTVATSEAPSLTEAVTVARAMAKPGDAVVLAPACASFDQFKSYAHRGEVFTSAVLALAPESPV